MDWYLNLNKLLIICVWLQNAPQIIKLMSQRIFLKMMHLLSLIILIHYTFECVLIGSYIPDIGKTLRSCLTHTRGILYVSSGNSGKESKAHAIAWWLCFHLLDLMLPLCSIALDHAKSVLLDTMHIMVSVATHILCQIYYRCIYFADAICKHFIGYYYIMHIYITCWCVDFSSPLQSGAVVEMMFSKVYFHV